MAGEVPRSAMKLSGGTPSGVPKHVGTTLLVGGTITFAILYGTWSSMKAHKRREELSGRNPHHEQLTGNLTRKWTSPEIEGGLKPMTGHKAKYSDIPPAFPNTDHHPNSHMTIGKFNKTWREDRAALLTDPPAGPLKSESQIVSGGPDVNPRHVDVGEDLREKNMVKNMVPPPQRGRNDGSGKAYTKSPDFVKNYEKTAHARHTEIPTRGENVNPDAPISQGVNVGVGNAPQNPLSPAL